MKPTWRKPFGILALLAGLAVYAVLVTWLIEPISAWPVWAQVPVYVVLGVLWLLPLRPFLIWMETGRFR
ncbi:DUF2842 domain-containing protein [Novosphingobium sp. ZN18A2]|uniref:DUF2842 domain-containing protein n=1 Tax=Novosphingobium sp. ZN18A2 TaxID=3079861 RepID=UPI0030CB660C